MACQRCEEAASDLQMPAYDDNHQTWQGRALYPQYEPQSRHQLPPGAAAQQQQQLQQMQQLRHGHTVDILQRHWTRSGSPESGVLALLPGPTRRLATPELQRRAHAERVNSTTWTFMRESVLYLPVGVVLGYCGFFAVIVPLLMRVTVTTLGLSSRPLYIPPTISELVSDWNSVEGRAFFGFELGAAVCILLSWYPFKLANAICNPLHGGCCTVSVCGYCVFWATVRQFVGPIGLLLVACIPTVSPSMYVEVENLCLVFWHCIAAMLMFIGYLSCEAHALNLWPFSCTQFVCKFGTMEYRWRYWTFTVALWTFGLFMAMQISTGFITLNRTCCSVSFTLEALSGLSMLANQLSIWVYATENWIDTPVQRATRLDLLGDGRNDTVRGRRMIQADNGLELSLAVSPPVPSGASGAVDSNQLGALKCTGCPLSQCTGCPLSPAH